MSSLKPPHDAKNSPPDQQAVEVREIAEIQDEANLRPTAHRFAWRRMNGCINAANPFAEADPDSVAPEETGDATRSSRNS
jgi:hypothetical protein